MGHTLVSYCQRGNLKFRVKNKIGLSIKIYKPVCSSPYSLLTFKKEGGSVSCKFPFRIITDVARTLLT